MSKLSDKLAYARGLLEGMDMQADTPERKLICALMDAMQLASDELSELRKSHDELSEYVDVLDDDISELETEVYGDFDADDELDEDEDEDDEDEDDEDEDAEDECDCGHHCHERHHHAGCAHDEGHLTDDMLDETLLERDCPNCGQKIAITPRMLFHREEPITCPSCGCKFVAADRDE